MRIGRSARYTAVAATVLALAAACTTNGTLTVTPTPSTSPRTTVTCGSPTAVPVDALVTKVRSLGTYHVAQGNYTATIDLPQTRTLIPNWIYGNNTKLVAYGTVDALDDLSAISTDAFTISTDCTSVTVTVPAITLDTPNIDPNASQLIDTQSGLINRFQQLVDPNSDAGLQLNQLAQQKIATKALASGLLQTGQKNLTTRLDTMLKGLGFTTVVVLFA